MHQQEQPLFWAQKTTEWKGFSTWSPNPVRSPECGLDSIWAAKRPRFCDDFIPSFAREHEISYDRQPITLPETNSSHLKMHGWKTSFLLGWPFFWGGGVRKCLFPHFFLRQMGWSRLPGGPLVLWLGVGGSFGNHRHLHGVQDGLIQWQPPPRSLGL